jgi:3-carboxy-cis,cis-muconate cycloisomerase
VTFRGIFVPDELADAVDDRAWLEAMLAFEAALANAEALVGTIPAEAASAIAEACDADRFDVRELAVQGRAAGNPAEPLVRALRRASAPAGSDFVHWGATSQDVVDTAAMLVSRRALSFSLDAAERLAAAAAALARRHRDTVMAGRTLLQQAVPTTFGAKAAGWLVAVAEARQGLLRANGRLALQLGGAVGTLAPLGDDGPAVAEHVAATLGLELPPVPWHGDRTRVAELGAVLAVAAGTAAKIAADVALLQQSEVGEVRDPGGGGSSTMPQKQNPVATAVAVACAREASASAGLLLGSMVGEHERAAGAWHAEWDALSRALAAAGGALDAVAALLERLEVDTGRMRANLQPQLVSERLSFALTRSLGRERAHALLREAAAAPSLAEALRGRLPDDELAALLDPATYLGSAGVFVDRALASYEEDGE